MADAKIFVGVITNCNECPYWYIDEDGKDCCRQLDTEIATPQDNIFPEDCPFTTIDSGESYTVEISKENDKYEEEE